MIALWFVWAAFVLTPSNDTVVTIDRGAAAEISYQLVHDGIRLTKVYE